MGYVGGILIALAVVAFVWGFLMKVRASRVVDAPHQKTGDIAQKGTAIANPKGAISAEGNVTCPQPLVSPVSGTTCLYYEVKVTAAWKDGDTHKTKELGKEKRAAQFAIDDGSGPVWVDAREGGDFEPDQVKEETKGTGLLGGITGQDLQFGNYRVSTGMLSMGTKYTVRESVLPAVPRVYVCGKVGSSNEITKPSWRNLLITHKTRDDYLSHAAASAKYAFLGGAAGVVIGIILIVVSSLIGGDSASAKTAATATATAAADTGAPAGTAAPSGTGATTPPATPPAKAPPAATPAGKTAPPAAKGKKK
jgi:hypothetical protein